MQFHFRGHLLFKMYLFVFRSDSANCTNLENYISLDPMEQLDAHLSLNDYERSKITFHAKNEIDELESEDPSYLPIVVIEGTLLFKAGLDELCDEVRSPDCADVFCCGEL